MASVVIVAAVALIVTARGRAARGQRAEAPAPEATPSHVRRESPGSVAEPARLP